jgi:hypothetical protein
VSPVVSWALAGALVVTQLATVLASSPTTWFGWLFVSLALFGCLAVSRSLASRHNARDNPEAKFEAKFEAKPAAAHHAQPEVRSPDSGQILRSPNSGHILGSPSTQRSWNWFTLAAMALLLFVGLLKAPHRSNDVYAYGAYGRIVSEHSVSPYTTRPAAFPEDPVIDRMAKGWRTTRSVYGPAFTLLSAVGMRVAGTSELIERLWFQALAAIATGCSALLLKRLSPANWWLFALNPATLIVVAHEGHNDALVGLGILSALWFLSRSSVDATTGSLGIHGAIGSLVFAASIKITAILAVPALAIWIVRRLGWKRSARIGVPWVLVCGGLFAATGGPVAFDAFRGLRTFRSTTSLWHLHWIRELTDRADGKPGLLALTVPAIALAATGLLVLWRSWTSDRSPDSGHILKSPDSGHILKSPDSGHIWRRPDSQQFLKSPTSEQAGRQERVRSYPYDLAGLVTRTVLPLIVFIALGLYILPWYWGWLLAPAILLPGKIRTTVGFSSAAHTLAYGAGTQLHDTFATVLTTARLVTPLAFVVVVACAVLDVARKTE